MASDTESLPFSELVNVRTLSKKGSIYRYDAPSDVAVRIADMHDLLAVESFHAEALVTPWKKNGVKITGHVMARIIQPCALSMEPLENTVDEPIELLMVPEGSKLAVPKLDGEGEIVVDPEGPDLPDVFSGDVIDLAGIWLEFFSLGMDPFAHHADAALPSASMTDSGSEEASPFAALAEWKKH